MKNKTEMEMQIHTTQTSSHMHGKSENSMYPIYPHPHSIPYHTIPFHPASIAHPAKRAHLNSVSAFYPLRVKSV